MRWLAPTGSMNRQVRRWTDGKLQRRRTWRPKGGGSKDHEVLLLPLKMQTDQLLKPTIRKLFKKDNPRRQRNRNRVAATGPRRWQVQGQLRH